MGYFSKKIVFKCSVNGVYIFNDSNLIKLKYRRQTFEYFASELSSKFNLYLNFYFVNIISASP